MTRIQIALAAVIGVEAAVGASFAYRQLSRHTPPPCDGAFVDPLAAAELSARTANVRTPGQWAALGEALLATGYFPEGEACYREAVNLDAGDAGLAFKHAFALERLGRAAEANGEYRRAIDLGHERAADCWHYIGRNFLRIERPDDAREAFVRSGIPLARYELAKSDFRAGKAAEAAAGANGLAEEYPTADQPVSLLYRLALGRRDGAAAAVLADRFPGQASRLPNPFQTEVNWVSDVDERMGQKRLIQDAHEAMRAGRPAAAEPLLRKALAADWTPVASDLLAEDLFLLGRGEEAAAVLAQTIERAGPMPGMLWRLGDIYRIGGRIPDARRVWERAVPLATGRIKKSLFRSLADLLMKQGESGWATSLYARASTAAGIEEFDAGRLDDAARSLTRAVELDAGSAQAWYYLGEVGRARNRPSEAAAAYTKCLEIDPDYGRAIRAMKLIGG